MKTACSTAAFTKQPLDKTLKTIGKMGFGYVDLLMMENWAHINPSELSSDPISKAKQTIELLMENSLIAVAINANLSNPINTGNAEVHKTNMAETEALGIFAEEIGIPVLVLQPGRIIDELGPEKSRQNSIQALKDMVEVTDKYGIVLAIETHVDSVAEKYADSLAMIEAVPGLKLAYDPSHFIMTQQS
ncbi:TIM barrel protein, partial [Candidatus Poribacteria bacterium]|nr:TIM barrel protein [Candidatus Poribacteria bacterium]